MGPKLEEFEILSTIGSGSHGTVRKIRRRLDNQILVWKELNYGSMSETEKQGLVTEVNLLRELRHPNVVKFLHHVVERRTTTLYILMEYCPGGDLKRLISKCRQTSTFLEEGFIWRVLKQVCQALKVCHSRDLCGGRIILHRDIKPANVFLDAEGDVKLGDFGLARTLNSEASFATTFVGTPYYMSPEVINGQEYNEKSDMWSLGCLIYELCALHPPFQATNHKQLSAKIREARYDRIPIQYSNELQEILSLLLTYEDFLRPTALMVLHHTALQARTSTKNSDVDDDPMYHSLSPTVLLNSTNRLKLKESESENTERADDRSGVKRECELGAHFSEGIENGNVEVKNSSLKANTPDIARSPLFDTYRVNDIDDNGGNLVDEMKRVLKNIANIKVDANDGKTEKKVEEDHRKEPALDDTIEKICREANEAGKSSDVKGLDAVITEADLVKPNCACGGMSTMKWRERVLALREAETAVRERELDVRERERDVIHREHHVAAMEKEVRQHLVRAQIYLRQSRHRRNAATSPQRPSSDMDTTMSADLEDEVVHTTAKPDPQCLENPFLKMRGEISHPEKHVSFDEKPLKFKSHTLDNPKSRLKRGSIFGLAERNAEKREITKDQGVEKVESRAPLKQVNVCNSTPKFQGQKCKSNTPFIQERVNTSNMSMQHQINNSNAGKPTLGGKTAIGLRGRSKSSENMSIKSSEAFRDKENTLAQGIKEKKVPEIKQSLKTGKTGSYTFQRPLKRNGSGRKSRSSKAPTLQFYNVV